MPTTTQSRVSDVLHLAMLWDAAANRAVDELNELLDTADVDAVVDDVAALHRQVRRCHTLACRYLRRAEALALATHVRVSA